MPDDLALDLDNEQQLLRARMEAASNKKKRKSVIQKDWKKQFRNVLPFSTTKIPSNLSIDQASLVAFRATNTDQISVIPAEKKDISIHLPLRKKLALHNVN